MEQEIKEILDTYERQVNRLNNKLTPETEYTTEWEYDDAGGYTKAVVWVKDGPSRSSLYTQRMLEKDLNELRQVALTEIKRIVTKYDVKETKRSKKERRSIEL